MTKSTVRKIASPALVALSLTLAACGGTYNPGLESVHQPVVNRFDYTLDLSTGGDAGLASGESQRLAAWFDTLGVGYGDRISIDGGSAYAGSASRDAIAAVAARDGLLLAEGAPITTGTVADGMVRVVVSRMAASVSGCPDWSRASQPEYGMSTMSNFGCASNTNLAAMVADPEDLVRGREGRADGQVASKAIQSFRAKKPSGDEDLKIEKAGK